MKKTIKKIRESAPMHPAILTSSVILPAGTLIFLTATLWNLYKATRKEKG